MANVLGKRIEAFEERDSFLRALLGLDLVCRRFDRVLSEFGGPGPGTGATDGQAEPDDALLLVLGALAVRRRLGRELDGLTPEDESPRGPAPASAGGRSGGLLR